MATKPPTNGTTLSQPNSAAFLPFRFAIVALSTASGIMIMTKVTSIVTNCVPPPPVLDIRSSLLLPVDLQIHYASFEGDACQLRIIDEEAAQSKART